MTSHQDLTLPVKFIEKLTVYDICCVDERLSNIYNLLCESPTCPNAALQSSPQVCDYPTNCHDSGGIQSDHPAYYNDLTPSYLFQNLKSYLCGVRYAWQCMIQGCLRWCCIANRFHLTVYDVINYNVTYTTNSYVFLENVHFTDI